MVLTLEKKKEEEEEKIERKRLREERIFDILKSNFSFPALASAERKKFRQA